MQSRFPSISTVTSYTPASAVRLIESRCVLICRMLPVTEAISNPRLLCTLRRAIDRGQGRLSARARSRPFHSGPRTPAILSQYCSAGFSAKDCHGWPTRARLVADFRGRTTRIFSSSGDRTMLRFIAGFASAFALLSSATVLAQSPADFGDASRTGRTTQRLQQTRHLAVPPGPARIRARSTCRRRSSRRTASSRRSRSRPRATRRSIASTCTRPCRSIKPATAT